ncbi:hypothetical protein EZS27_032219 [termite gut metagenome]|uniref:DUF3256 family protein n=1 Tax=termite gut metagenome TaxID=433724 RepID=A0A5J4Q9F7_9ZZZZ
MKKILLLLFLMLPVTASLSAQEAKELFIHIPDSLMPLLTPVNRADFVDFLESNMKAQVKNKFGNTSEMTDLTSDYIRLQVTSQSAWQMKVLALSDTTKVICTVSTACAPVCDSYIRFFTTDWKELPVRDYLPLPPRVDDFFQTPDSDRIDEYNRMRTQADIPLIKGDLSKTDNILTFTFTTLNYMGKEEAEMLKEYLRGAVVYEWKEGKYQQ